MELLFISFKKSSVLKECMYSKEMLPSICACICLAITKKGCTESTLITYCGRYFMKVSSASCNLARSFVKFSNCVEKFCTDSVQKCGSFSKCIHCMQSCLKNLH